MSTGVHKKDISVVSIRIGVLLEMYFNDRSFISKV